MLLILTNGNIGIEGLRPDGSTSLVSEPYAQSEVTRVVTEPVCVYAEGVFGIRFYKQIIYPFFAYQII